MGKRKDEVEVEKGFELEKVKEERGKIEELAKLVRSVVKSGGNRGPCERLAEGIFELALGKLPPSVEEILEMEEAAGKEAGD